MKVPFSEYPTNRPWEDKVFSMPNLPRGSEGLIAVLRNILEMVNNHCKSTDIVETEGSRSQLTLEAACVRLRPMRLVSKTTNCWVLTEEAQRWIESNDNLYLAAHLCANIRFLAEVLYYLDEPKKSPELQEIAAQKYSMGWKTLSDINSRLIWLRQFGLVEYQDFSMKYLLTETGKEFMNHVTIVEPIVSTSDDDETLNETDISIEEWALSHCQLDQQQLVERKQSIGYIPGNTSDICNTIAEYLSLIQTGADFNRIRSYAKENYDIAPSSISAFFSMLTNLGAIERKADMKFALTEIGKQWMEHKNIIELICCLQHSFRFVFEMLNELSQQTLSAKELAAISKVSYGFDKEYIEEIRRRIIILKAGKLIQNVGRDTFTITNRGKLLLKQFRIQDRFREEVSEVFEEESTQTSTKETLLTEIRLASRDSMNPNRFEQAVKSAFEALGFTATWLGGAGKTDVLIHAPGSPKFSFSAAVDAKSTAAGSVTDTLVDFDTLEEHRKKHEVDYSIVVGHSFHNERLINRAIEHKVLLMDVDSLEQLIKAHEAVPIKVSAYRKIFSKSGIADISLVNEDRQRIIRFGKLMRGVMNCLIAESTDPITEGLLMEKDIYRTLRDCRDMDEPPTLDDITSMLKFLSSPLIGCVEKTKEGYCATGSLEDASRKFSFYAKSCT